MKILKNLLLLSFSLAILCYSCSSDNGGGNNQNEELANQQNETENRVIPIAELESGVKIEGATTKTGTPPAPTNNVDFQISSNSQEAFQENGFVISFSSSANFAGAYIVLQDTDGNKSNSYFEVPNYVIETAKSTKSKHSRFFNKSNKTGDEYQLNVDLSDVAPGQFCYEICLFDAENNISRIEKVCVEIEAWGGNASLVGNWELRDQNYDDTIPNFPCENGSSLQNVKYENYLKLEALLTINENGSFVLSYYEESNELDWETSYSTCNLTYFDEVTIYDEKEIGNWAYNENDNTLTLVSFKYEDVIQPEYSEEYPDGELILESATVEIVGNELTLTQVFSESGVIYTYVNVFVRK